MVIEEQSQEDVDFQQNLSQSGFEFKNDRNKQFLEVGKKSMTADNPNVLTPKMYAFRVSP